MLVGIGLLGANMSGAKYDVGKWVQTGCLEGAIVGAVDWSNMNLEGAQLHSVALCGADLHGAQMCLSLADLF